MNVETWNFFYPSGTAVELTNDDGKTERTFTRSEAWYLGSGTAVVKVNGRAGGYLLSRIRPVRGQTPDHVVNGKYPGKVKETATCITCGMKFYIVKEYVGLFDFYETEEYQQYVRQRERHAAECSGFCGMANEWGIP